VIGATSLVKRFGRHEALRGIDLAVATGELFALIGPDGAGKTTFFRLVAGVITPTSGSVRRDAGATFGLVPQRFSLYEDLTVDENLDLRASLYSVPVAEVKRRGADLLARPDLLLLDEPTTGVDPVSRRELWQVLAELHQGGLTIVVSTPYMDEAEQ